MNYKDGSKYEGDWKQNVKEVEGIMYYNDGSKYEGLFKNDERVN